MIALWITLAVLAALLVVGLVVAVPRRGRRTRPPAPPAGTAAPPAGTAVPPVAPAPARPPAEPGAPVPTPGPGAPTAAEPAPAGAAPPEAEPAALAPPELRERLGKTRGLITGYVRALRSRGSVDDEAWDDLEEALLRADVGVATTTALLEDLRARVAAGELRGAEAVVDALRQDLRAALDTAGGVALDLDPGHDGPTVWLFVGVNGVGKTTTIGKVARRQTQAGHSVLLAAGDTFRAAAGEQLEQWAQRSGVDIVRGAEGGDPSAVVFDAVQRAAATATTWCWPTPPGGCTPR